MLIRKSGLLLLTMLGVGLLVTGCAPTFDRTATRTVAITGATKSDEILEAAIETAQNIGFPAMSKLDKANGIVEFGGFSGSVMGITAQVRVLPNNQAEVTVKRFTAYIPLGVDEQADLFRTKFEEQLKLIQQNTQSAVK